MIKRVDALNRRDTDDRPQLPRSQMHMLREALSQGKAFADARLGELARLNEQGLADLIEPAGSLFDETDDPGVTRFLDALVSAEFWGNQAGTTSATEEHEQ